MLLVSSVAWAEDPPSRVGSLNYLSGEVSYALRGQAGEPGAADALSWTEADFDQPVSEDMSLRTGAKARARIRIGADAIEMSDDTVLNLLNLGNRLIEASLGRGRIYLQIASLGAGEGVEIEMQRGSLALLAPGGYDIEIDGGDGPTRITVFDGNARFFGGNADTPVAAGEELQVTGNYPAVTATAVHSQALPNLQPAANPSPPANPSPANPLPAQEIAAAAPSGKAGGEPGPAGPPGGSPPAAPAVASASPPPPAGAAGRSDDFMYFVAESKSDTAATQSVRYVSPATTGYDDLDRYGQWATLPDGEAVWYPDAVPADWAPYRFGHWDWIAPWGWTWVDDEPWGFAPFHYGRWIDLENRWGWVPGPVVADPVYAPALVAFVDTGADAGPDGPDVGWFPLAPGEAYVPWYGAGPAYVARVNAGARGGAGEAGRAGFANRRLATVTTRGAFSGGRPVQQAMARIPADRLAQAGVLHGAPHVAPAPRPAVRAEGRGEEGPRPAENRRNAPEHGAAPHERAAASRPPAASYRGGGQQFAHPEGFRNTAAAYRGGATQFRQPEAFRTPMSSFAGRGFQMPQFGGRAAPAAHFGGGSFSRHK